MQARTSLIVAALAAALPQPAESQRPGSVEMGAVGVWHNKTVPHDGLRGFGGGGRLGIWLPLGFEVEGEVDLTKPANSATGNRYTMTELGMSALYNVMFGSGPSFYLRAGYTKIHAESTCQIAGNPCNSFGAITGGGGFRIPISGPLNVRAEATVKSRSVYGYTSVGASLGFTVVTGGSAGGGRALADDDGDGVPNGKDRCPDTARGALVDQRGCPTDLDGDGVPDGLDRCPGTPKGTPVDAFGCPVKRPD
jgi:outer membrane protein with beta-barrel domain/thrombospondin type 3 repeat protein